LAARTGPTNAAYLKTLAPGCFHHIHICSLRTLAVLARLDFEGNHIAFIQGAKAAGLNGAVVYKYVRPGCVKIYV